MKYVIDTNLKQITVYTQNGTVNDETQKAIDHYTGENYVVFYNNIKPFKLINDFGYPHQVFDLGIMNNQISQNTSDLSMLILDNNNHDNIIKGLQEQVNELKTEIAAIRTMMAEDIAIK